MSSIYAYTPYFNFRLVNFDAPRWHTDEWANWQSLDATLRSIGALANSGVWTVATSYTIGDRVVDSTTATIYQAAVTHTSATSGTFAADRATNPTYWTQITQVPNYRGSWLTAVSYSVGDIISVNDTTWYYCLVNHTSDVFATDLAVPYWTVIFDFSAFTSYYYGPRAVETNFRPDGTPSQAGDIYYNTASSLIRLYDGAAWGAFGGGGGGTTASSITFTPTGGIAATDVQTALAEVDSEKANRASATLTGVPTAPTAAVDTATTQLATCAFVINQGYLKSATAASTYLTSATATATYMSKANNLSDVASAVTARANLSVYSTAQDDALLLGKSNVGHTHVPADIIGLSTSLPFASYNLR